MTDYDELLRERYEQEDRLRSFSKSLGFDVDGGGIGFGGYDIFVYLNDSGPTDRAIVLHSIEDVDNFIAERTNA